MRWIKGLLAAVILAALALLPPLLLTSFVGSPFPSDIGLTSDLSDEALIKLLSLVVWLLWAQTIWCVGVEIVASIRSSKLTRAPGTFAIQQHLARALVGAVIAAAVTTPILASSVGAAPAHTAEPVRRDMSVAPEAVGQDPVERPTSASPSDAPFAVAERTAKVTVHRGDSLWSLAEERLGDGERWSEIAVLNEGHVMSDGRIFRSSQAIHPGWHLVVPDDAGGADLQAGLNGDREYIVQPGDTLSEIAQEHAGDAAAWPNLFEQSTKLDQPRPLIDPDLIYAGQRIDLGERDSAPSPDTDRPSPAAPKDAERPTDQRMVSPRAVEGDIAVEQDPAEPRSSASTGDSPAEAERDDRLPGWVLPGIVGGGSLLAGSLFLTLCNRRAIQHRMRRPGRTINAAGPELVDVEKSITVAGRETLDVVELVDALLKRTASALAQEGRPLPAVAAVEVSPTFLALHLRRAVLEAPAPWAVTDDGSTWIFERHMAPDVAAPEDADAPAPWPLLVTVGHDDRGHTWLLNIEGLSVAVTGDPIASHDFARFLAAEIACNPWSRHTTLDLVGVAEEIVPMRPERIRSHASASPAAAEAVADAVRTIDRLGDYGVDTPTARAHQTDPDPWLPRVLLIDGDERSDEVGQLVGLLRDHPGRTGAAVVLVGNPATDEFGIHITEGRQMTIPSVNLTVAAVGLTTAEAQGCAALLAQADIIADREVPNLEGEEGWKQMATATGSLRNQFTLSRDARSTDPSASMLGAPDEVYIEHGATTKQDLQALAPRVAESVRDEVADADPSLDDDVAEWFADFCPRPRLALLGPVGARTSGKALDRRKPFYTELFAYLATRPYGATTDEVATAFGIKPSRVRIDINKLRDWLGVNPVTGAKYLPDARVAPSALRRGIGVYEIGEALG